MSSKSNLASEKDIVYIYDGSFDGFLCCVFESVYKKELPIIIYSEASSQPTLFKQKYIDTDIQKAVRVLSSIPKKISSQAVSLIKIVFLSCLQDKELAMLRFLLLGYQQGPSILKMLGHPDVAPLMEAEKHLLGERHLLTGFIRFEEHDGVLTSTISPKNYVLPLLAGHFTARFPKEDFLIYDKVHKDALICQNGKRQILHLDSIEFPAADKNEQTYQNLWKQFYKTIAIKERINHKCRQTHMPKRYWENMTEMKEYL